MQAVLGGELDVGESGIVDEVGVDEKGELGDPIGESRSWSRVVGVRVDGNRAASEWRERRLAGGAFMVEATGRDDDQFGPRLPHRFP